MILVFAGDLNERVRFAFRVILDPSGVPYELTDSRERFRLHGGIRIAYGAADSDALHIPASGWLAPGNHLREDPPTGDWNGIPTLFPRSEGDVPFDLPAAAFVLASRMEEYGSPVRDTLGRHDPTHALAFRLGWLRRPVIDEWRTALWEEMGRRFGDLLPPLPPPAFELTIDVDSAFAYRHKGIRRTAGGFALDALRFRPRNAWRRVRTLLGLDADPYDTYDWIREECEKAGVSPRWFFLLADFGKMDKNVPHSSKALRQRIRELGGRNAVGIHPGAAASASGEILRREIARLSEITGQPVTDSRQHYLLFRFPGTPRMLLASGIRRDYSMGYAALPGFRLGTSHPVPWYDLERECITPLELVPFCVMDTTLRKYMQLGVEEACDEIRELAAIISRSSGRMTVIWHNETLCERDEWMGWREVFAYLLNEASGGRFSRTRGQEGAEPA